MHKVNKQILIFIIILALGTILRVWKLQQYPVHLSHDEVSQAYDAISIVQTGRDSNGNFLPTIFASIGDYKSPFYGYATALVYLMVGNHEWMIRVVSATFGILVIPAVFWFTLKLIKNTRIAYLAALFSAISPAEIYFSRKSFEGVAGIFFLLIVFACILKYYEQQRQHRWLFLGILFSAIGMYTYFSHAMIIPLMLIAFLLIFRNKFVSTYKKYLPFVLWWIIFVIPLIIIIIINPGSRYRSQNVFITQDSILTSQISRLSNQAPPLQTLLSWKLVGDYSFNRYLRQFDPSYLFGNGLGLTNQGMMDTGPLLILQLPLLIIGFLYLLKNNLNREFYLFIAWIILGVLPSGLTFESSSPHRMMVVFVLFNILSGIGAYWLLQRMAKLKLYKILLGFSLGVLAINFIYFLHVYFVNNSYEKSEYIQYPFKQISEFAWSQYNNFSSIVVDPLTGGDHPYIAPATQYYLAYFGNYPPLNFQREYRLGTKERETIFGKYHIRKINWIEDQYSKDTLFIGSWVSIPIQSIDKSKLLKIFYNYNGTPAFYAVKS